MLLGSFWSKNCPSFCLPPWSFGAFFSRKHVGFKFVVARFELLDSCFMWALSDFMDLELAWALLFALLWFAQKGSCGGVLGFGCKLATR